jgi:uncharacterized protein (TIGR03437 family)
VRNFNRSIELLAFAAAVIVGHSDAGLAQTITLSPPVIGFTVPGPGGTASATFSVNLGNGLSVTSVLVSPINTTSGGSWLSGPSTVINGNQFTLNVGNTTLLSPNTVYQGSVGVTVTTPITAATPTGSISTTFPASLQVGNTPGSTGTPSALVANPSSITFSETTPGQASPASQTISVNLNGVLLPIISLTFLANPVGGPTFLNSQLNPQTGTATVTVNTVISIPGTYTATLTANTNSGTVQIPVTLCYGGPCATLPGTTSGNGLTATPNPVSFQVQTGGATAPQPVNIYFDGTATSITSITANTNTGGNWLLPSSGAAGVVNVGVNPTSLAAGTYVGTVFVNTPEGQITFQVNLTVGGTPTLTTTPSSVNFAYQIGTNNPQSQPISITSNGTAVSYAVFSSTTNGGTQWLIVSPQGQGATPGTLTVSVNPSGLPAGVTYTGNVQVSTFGGATNPTINIPVSLLVTTSPILATSLASVSFTAPSGGAAPPQNLQITSSSSPLNYTLSSSVSSPPGGNWLQVATQSGVTPGTVTVAVNPTGLAAGTYTGTINVTSPNAGNGTLQVPVSLTINPGAVLQLTPAALSFAYEIGQATPGNQSVVVGSPTGVLGYTVSAATNSGQSWLLVSPTAATAPGNFVASVNPVGLGAGTYQGTITVTPNAGVAQTIPVTLVVSNTALLVSSPGSIVFNSAQGSTTNSFQNISVTSTDSTLIAFNVSATTNAVSNWLLVSASTGVTPAVLTLSANPNGLAPGTYTGTVTLTVTNPANVTNSPDNIAVTLVVAPTATLSLSQSSVSFSQSSSGPTPNPQTVSVTSVGGTITFATSVTTNAGGNWLTVTPTNSTTPTSLTITANGGNLVPGVYTGQVTLTSPGAAAPQTIFATLTVSNSPTIAVSPTALAPVSFSIGGVNPATQTINLSVSGGVASSFTATATTTAGGSWLAVSPVTGTTPSTLTVTLNPANLTAGTYSGAVVIAITGATNTPVNVPITLTVTQPVVVPPTVVAIQNAASSAPTSVSPGLNIVIYGSNMGPATLANYQIGSSGSFATTVAGTQVLFDSVPAPLIYTKSTQVSVMVPYELEGRTTTSMVVSYNGVASTPLQLRIVESAPGIYTINQSGTGQGAILNQNGTVNGPTSPEVAGNVIQIYATGEGQTSPAGVDGGITPSRPPFPAPILPVTVNIGGQEVQSTNITYAGEAPGLISGVLQVNAVIPAGVPSGPAAVIIRVGGAASQTGVTVTVR